MSDNHEPATKKQPPRQLAFRRIRLIDELKWMFEFSDGTINRAWKTLRGETQTDGSAPQWQDKLMRQYLDKEITILAEIPAGADTAGDV